MNNPIRENAVIDMDGQTYVVKSILSDLKDVVLQGKGSVLRAVDFTDLFNGVAAGSVTIPGYSPDPVHKAWSDSEYAEAQFRKKLVEVLESKHYQQADDVSRTKLLEVVAEKYGHRLPSPKTIKNYAKKYNLGGFNALLPRFNTRGGSGWSSKAKQKEFAETVILETYARNDKLNITATTILINDMLSKEADGETDIPKISAKTVSRIIHRLPRDLILCGRMDPRTYRLVSRQAVQSFHVEHAFELMQIDAKTIDMYVRDSLGKRYSQITLYAMICSRTGYPVGIFVSAGAPSEYTLLKLFEFFFSPKDDAFKARFDIETQWPAPCGLNKVLLDNAAENAGAVALEIVRDLGIEIHYARAYRGDDKPHVESFFKVLEEKVFKRMPGAKQSSEKHVTNRHERAESEACYSVEDVYHDVVKFVADVYVHEPRVKLGFRYGQAASIKHAMDEELKRFMPPPPPSLAQVQGLILQKHRVTRKVQHYGIDFEGFQYHSLEFANLARNHFIKEVEVLFNPAECISVYAVSPLTGELIRLENKMRDVPNVSFEQIKEIRKEYAGPVANMAGHDYQRIYASMLAKWNTDSGRRKTKVKENNQQGRALAQGQFHAGLKTELEKRSVVAAAPLCSHDDDDDDFVPAPRGEV
ncbi:MAG: Mu transposase C-terminal domain-containing protein [Pseudoalteromonas distincta]